MRNFYYIIFCFFGCVSMSFSQDYSASFQLEWKGLREFRVNNQFVKTFLYCEGAGSDSLGLPVVKVYINIPSGLTISKISVDNKVFADCDEKETAFTREMDYVQNNLRTQVSIFTSPGEKTAVLSFIPLITDDGTDKIHKLLSFTVNAWFVQDLFSSGNENIRSYAENSVLSQGTWIKIKLDKSGIYKISYDELVSYGIDASSADPRNIRVYGNGGQMLPELNSVPRLDDLVENSIFVEGEDDGIFNTDDYILFYGQGPHKISYNSAGYFEQTLNIYSDYSYYFVTVAGSPGKRVQPLNSLGIAAGNQVSSFNYFEYKEDDLYNFIESGKRWFGEMIPTDQFIDFNYTIPGLETGSDVIVRAEVASRTYPASTMKYYINDIFSDSILLTALSPSSPVYARIKKNTLTFPATDQEFKISMYFSPANNSSLSWLSYITVNARCSLSFNGPQMSFRDVNSFGPFEISDFQLASTNAGLNIWKVTNPLSPQKVMSDFTGGTHNFRLHTDTLHEFIAFDGSAYLVPEFVSAVENQNLHATPDSLDLLIISDKLFLDQAQKLAELHALHDDMSYLITTPEKVYNEFSSGGQDPTAIRDYVKMIWDRSEGKSPRYLLLFGDGSYDPKDRITENTNFIVTFQTMESLDITSSYVIDDYFGLMDDNEGNDAYGVLDVGIGRLPVKTLKEAEEVVNKIEKYITYNDTTSGPWTQQICIVADDEDMNIHLDQAEELSFITEYNQKEYNLKKIYLDAYKQEKIPSGHRYPDVNKKINQCIESGSLIMNYVGHGGITGWAGESVLNMNSLTSWKNKDKLPLFVTATCEFSRFDEPEIVTAGENVLLMPESGGIALLTTTRLAFSISNFKVNERFYYSFYELVGQDRPYLGDLVRLSKPPGDLSTRNFVLLGDPALKVKHARWEVKTTEINGHPIGFLSYDTLSAGTVAEFKGVINGPDGNIDKTYDGIIVATVFDKPSEYTTIANDESSLPAPFVNQDRIIYRGQVKADSGEFTILFPVPRDIDLKIGFGKVTYYGNDNGRIASGFSVNFKVGGIDEDMVNDNTGPEIGIYMNSLNFRSGDQTNDDPLLIARLWDEFGINLSSAGMGHEITAVLDGNTQEYLVLNDYYVPDTGSYTGGTVLFNFNDLSEGTHQLTLKAWDNMNNSSEKSITFVIDKSSRLHVDSLYNFPNPFRESTTFRLKHNKPGEEFNAELTVYDLHGRKVYSDKRPVISNGASTDMLIWNGHGSNGEKLKAGLYFYHVIFEDKNGNKTQYSQKLSIVR